LWEEASNIPNGSQFNLGANLPGHEEGQTYTKRAYKYGRPCSRSGSLRVASARADVTVS